MSQKPAILILDKQTLLVDLLTQTLSDQLLVLGATSALDAAEQIQRHRPDVAVINPEVQDCMAIVQYLRLRERPCPIIALTSSPEMRTALTQMGIETIIDNTVSLKVLLRTVQSLIQPDSGVFAMRPTILVVDDEPEMCELELKVLSRKGYPVRTAGGGDEAIEAVNQDSSIGVVLLDIKMSGKDGLEVLKEINAGQNPPQVIVVTGINDEAIAAQSLKLGAFDYILKPFDPEKLESVIIASLSHAAYHRKSLWQRFTSKS